MSDIAQVRESIERRDFIEVRQLALSALNQAQDGETRARLIHNLALATHRAGDSAEALAILTGNASLFESVSPAIKGNYHNELGIVLYNLGRTKEAIAQYRVALDYYEQAGTDAPRASVLNNLALCLKDAGRFREAHQHIQAARRILERAGATHRLAEVSDSYSTIIAAQMSKILDIHIQRSFARSIITDPARPRAP
jgi:tetratricopeptide (TPR) repeat protein